MAVSSVAVMDQARRRLRDLHRDFQRVEADVSGHVADLLRGSRAVKLYAMEASVEQQFHHDALLIGRKNYQMAVLGHMENMKQEGLNYVCYGILVVVCTWRFLQGRLEPGAAAAVLTSFYGLTHVVGMLFTSVTLWGPGFDRTHRGRAAHRQHHSRSRR